LDSKCRFDFMPSRLIINADDFGLTPGKIANRVADFLKERGVS